MFCHCKPLIIQDSCSWPYDKTYDTQSFVGHENYVDPRLKMSHSGCAFVWHFQPRVVIFPCPAHCRASSVKCRQGELSAVVTLQVLVTGVPAVDDDYLLTLSNVSTQGPHSVVLLHLTVCFSMQALLIYWHWRYRYGVNAVVHCSNCHESFGSSWKGEAMTDDDWVKKCMEYEVDQEEDQRGPGERLSKRTVKHVNWTQRMLWIVVNGSWWRMSNDQDGCEWVSVSSGTGLPG